MADTALCTVDFHGTPLVAIAVDGKPFVAVRPICDALTIDFDSQRHRIARHPVLSASTVITTGVAADGKRREVLCLPLDKLNGWLFGISAARVRDPARRERLIDYQRECFDVLAAHFSARARPVPPPAPPAERLSAAEMQNLARTVDLMTYDTHVKAATAQSIWGALRRATGVRRAADLTVAHLPAVVAELQRCWALLTHYSRTCRAAEDTLRQQLRRSPVDDQAVCQDIEQRLMASVQATQDEFQHRLRAAEQSHLLRLAARHVPGGDFGAESSRISAALR